MSLKTGHLGLGRKARELQREVLTAASTSAPSEAVSGRPERAGLLDGGDPGQPARGPVSRCRAPALGGALPRSPGPAHRAAEGAELLPCRAGDLPDRAPSARMVTGWFNRCYFNLLSYGVVFTQEEVTEVSPG